jgi:hypothetical protein
MLKLRVFTAAEICTLRLRAINFRRKINVFSYGHLLRLEF